MVRVEISKRGCRERGQTVMSILLHLMFLLLTFLPVSTMRTEAAPASSQNRVSEKRLKRHGVAVGSRVSLEEGGCASLGDCGVSGDVCSPPERRTHLSLCDLTCRKGLLWIH